MRCGKCSCWAAIIISAPDLSRAYAGKIPAYQVVLQFDAHSDTWARLMIIGPDRPRYDVLQAVKSGIVDPEHLGSSGFKTDQSDTLGVTTIDCAEVP